MSAEILTPRQLEVAAMIARGMSYKKIGVILAISSRTVEDHVHAAAERIANYPTRPRDVVMLWYIAAHRDEAA